MHFLRLTFVIDVGPLSGVLRETGIAAIFVQLLGPNVVTGDGDDRSPESLLSQDALGLFHER